MSDGGHLRRGLVAGGVGEALAVMACVIALASSGASLGDLGLPLLALTALNGLVVAAFAMAAAWVRLDERRGIRRLFDGEIWAQWTIPADEWEDLTEALLAGERSTAADRRFGLVAAGVVGAGIAGTVILVAVVAMDPQTRNVAIPLALLVPVGLVAFVAAQNVVGPRRIADEVDELRSVPAPRVWFGPDGAYHEAEGFMSFDPLVAVADRTRSRGSIVFTVRTATARSEGSERTDLEILFPVPRGHAADAVRLVARYRRERVTPR